MCEYSVGQKVIWDGDGQIYTVTAVQHNPDTNLCTYNIQLVSNPSVTHDNVPQGNLRPVTT